MVRVKEGITEGEERLEALSFRFVKRTHRSTWLSDASFEAVLGLCLETGV